MLEMGDEAEIAQCEFCGTEQNIDLGVCCEPCGAYFCRKCWRFHNCGPLTDWNGREVREGDTLTYYQTNKTYKVLPTPGTFIKVGAAYGGNKKDPHTVIYPRLMIHQ